MVMVTIHCVRHGQGFHNLGAGDYNLPDPKLTPEGEAQCIELRNRNFAEQSHISLVAASPLSRTIQSAGLIFQAALESSTTPKMILAVPDAQETSDSPCDAGSDYDILKSFCQQLSWPVDLSMVKNGWNVKKVGSRYSPSTEAIEARARDLRLFFRKQARALVAAGDADVHIVLVAHGGFLHYFTKDWENAALYPGTGWANCEARAYSFESEVDSDKDEDAHLVELMDSRRKRGLDYPMFPHEQQRELFDQAMQAWEDQGLQNHNKIVSIVTEAEVLML